MMMRIQGGRIAALLILCALLAGCSAGTRDESPAPLEGAAWPTPRPTPVASSPTPFPKVDPAQVRRVDDRSVAPVGAGLASAQGGTAAPTSSPVGAVGAVGAGARPAPTITPSPAISGATARVRGPKGLNVRKGPGTTFAVLAGLRAGDAVKVLGVNEPGRDWAFVETSSGKQGWVSLPLLELSGAPPDLPARSSTSPQSSTLAASRSASAGASVVNPQSTINNPQSGIRNHASPQSVLAFQLSSGGDIMVVNADGSGLRRLTQGIDPVLSPDGKQVAFTRWDGTDGSLWVINLDGSGLRQVAGGIKQAKHPTWSPDGRRIAVNFQHEGRLDPARKCTNLATDDVPDIPWNVDKDSVKVEIKGQSPYIMPYLCYTSPADPHWSVRLVDVASGEAQDPVTDTYAFGPEWDPVNDWRIVTSGINGLSQMDANRGVLWALTDRREDHTPAFSPDGKNIAVAYNQGGRYDIQRLDAGGGGRVALTKPPLWLAAEGQEPWHNVAPAWSPDGSRIAFLTDRRGRWEIWVMVADGSNPRPMFSDALNAQLPLKYDFVDERMLSWGQG